MSDDDLENVAPSAEQSSDDSIVGFNARTRLVYRCESGGRLHAFRDREQTWPPSVYVPEPEAAYPKT